jgi:hypothetical protein
MKLSLREQLVQFGHLLQSALFPVLETQLGELTESARRLVATLEMIPLTRFIPASRGWMGRPSKDRDAIARAFIAKAVYGFSHTRQLLEALQRDEQLRRICGWETAQRVPHESTFSRAFDEFARMELPQFVHETLIRETQKDRVIGHIARDSTAIEAREHYPESPEKPSKSAQSDNSAIPVSKSDSSGNSDNQDKLEGPGKPDRSASPDSNHNNHSKPAPTTLAEGPLLELVPPLPSPPVATVEAPTPSAPRKSGRKRGSGGAHKRWKGGKPPRRVREGTRLQRQRTMSLPEMLADLPQACNLGGKKDSKGNNQYWRGYKLHLDVADGQIPISAVLTSASVHDSQVAIPLMTMSTQRVNYYCYDLMDSAYDAQHITEHSRGLGHVPIVDPPQRGRNDPNSILPNTQRQLSWAEADRYKERTMVERVNARLKDEFGARTVRVRGAVKVMAHLMFGVLALTADQLLRLGGQS